MAINERLVHTASAAAAGGTGNQEEGLILHLDANDVDSYDGDGDVWYDIKDYEYTPSTNVSEHFNTVTYTGNGSTNAVTGLGFQPDLVWIKNRDAAWSHHFIDIFRKTNTYYDALNTNTKNRQNTSESSGVVSLDLNGFTLGSSGGEVNSNDVNYVAWCWKAGGAGVANTDGTITSQVSVNNDLGFSIVSYAGTVNADDVGHGLDSAPDLVIAKNIDSFDSNTGWITYASPLSGERGLLDEPIAFASSTTHFRADPDSTVLKLSNNSSSNVNRSGDDFIAYCFTSKRGVSKVGSYIGNSSTNNKIYTGFEPAFVMLKNTSTSNTRWIIMDNARNPDNPATKVLSPNLNNAEDTSTSYWLLDWERDGFRLKYGADNEFNRSGDTFIYYAVAKSTNAGSLTPSTDGEEIETDLMFDPTLVHYSDSNYELTQDNLVFKGNADTSAGSHEGEALFNNYFNSGDTDKYYFEVETVKSTHGLLGFTDPTKYVGASGLNNTSWRSYYFYGISDGSKLTYNGSAISSSFSSGLNTSGQVTAVAIDVATRNVWMGTVSSGTITWFSGGDPATGTNPFLTLPTGWNIYQPLCVDSSWSGGSARYAWMKILRDSTATTLPTGFTQLKGAIKNADLELHLDAADFDGSTNTPTTWTDKTSNGNNGTITGAAFDAELGNYLNITSDSTYIDVPTANMLDSDFTIEMWYNLSSTSSSYKMLLGGSNYQNQTGLGHYVYGDTIKTWISVSGATSNIMTSPSVITANKWQHIVLKREGSTWTQYIDGEQVHTVTGSTASLSSPNSRIGRHYNSTGLSASGKSGQVRVYSSALTQAQIRQNYNFTKPSYPNSINADRTNTPTWDPSGYWDFSGGTSNCDSFFLPQSLTLNPWFTNTHTVSMWVNFDSFASYPTFWSTYDYAGGSYGTILRADNDGRIRQSGYFNNSSTNQFSSALSTGQWYHIVGSFSQGDCRLYIDKVHIGTNTATFNYPSGGGRPAIGSLRHSSATNTDNGHDGKISKVKLYDRFLTTDEIQVLYDEGY